MKNLLLPIAYNLAVLYWNIFRPTTVGVRVLVKNGEKYLLVKPSYSKWYYLPGGGVDHKKESLEEAALRELFEETNLTGKNPKLIEAHRNFIHNKRDTVITYSVEVEDIKNLKIDNFEIVDYGWYGLDELPSNTHQLTLLTLKNQQ